MDKRRERQQPAVDRKGWEKSDFPIICETCYGENPYLRMTRAEFDKECKICTRPFTVFRWRPGAHARYKKTEICQVCAKMKNVCQVCLLDLEFGLPVQVRDAALSHAGYSVDSIPESEANREWYQDQAIRKVEKGETLGTGYGQGTGGGPLEPSSAIYKLARSQPYYKRNLAHICSFWVKGECTRGDECPYRHEMPQTGELANQNIRDRYYGQDDPVAKKMMRRAQEMDLPLGDAAQPKDPDIRTVWVGNLTPQVSEELIRDKFYAYGEIQTIKMLPQQNCAFVTYAARDMAAKAIERTAGGTVSFDGLVARVSWARKYDRDVPIGVASVAPSYQAAAGYYPPQPIPTTALPPPGIFNSAAVQATFSFPVPNLAPLPQPAVTKDAVSPTKQNEANGKH